MFKTSGFIISIFLWNITEIMHMLTNIWWLFMCQTAQNIVTSFCITLSVMENSFTLWCPCFQWILTFVPTAASYVTRGYACNVDVCTKSPWLLHLWVAKANTKHLPGVFSWQNKAKKETWQYWVKILQVSSSAAAIVVCVATQLCWLGMYMWICHCMPSIDLDIS